MLVKKRIAFLVPTIENCGPVNVVFNIISNLDLNKFDIMLISLRDSSHNNYFHLIEKYCSLGILLHGVSNQEIENICEDIDIIHSHGFYPDKIVASLKNKKVKKITTIHCIFIKDYVQEYGFFKGILGSLLHIFYLRKNNFSYIVACSNTVKEYLSKYVNNKLLMNINNGVNQRVFISIDYKEKEARKKEYGLNGKRLFIFAGRMIRRKRVPELISFFIKTFGKDKSNVLLLLGDGTEMQKCKELATEQIKVIGMVSNPVYYYQMSDFVVSMSNAEGYPMSILEAVSCGCYAFLSDIPSHREFIELNTNCADFIDNLSNVNFEQQYDMNTKMLSAKIMANHYSDIYIGK